MMDRSRDALKRGVVLHIITTINKGGAENQLIQLVHGQVSRGFRVIVVYLKGDGFWLEFLRGIGVDCFRITPARMLQGLICRSGLKSLHSVEAVHAHMPPALFVAIPLFRLILLKRVVFTAHNDERMTRWSKYIDYCCARLMLGCTSRVVAISKSVDNFYRQTYSLQESKITVIPYCWNQAVYDYMNQSGMSLHEANLYQDGVIYIGAIARLEPQKRLDLLLSSFATMLRQYDSVGDVRLVIIGNGSMKEELKAQAKRLNIANSTIWIDASNTPLLHIKRWKYLCLTSAYEGFGLVLIEAIKSGKRVVAMDVSSIAEIIKKNGFLVEFGDTDSFARAMMRELVSHCPIESEDADCFSLSRAVESYRLVYAKTH